MKIGIIGTRGIPNQYGGFEQFVEFAAPALVARGHEVYVYTSSLHPYKEPEWNNVHLVRRYDPENNIGTAGQFVYDLSSIWDARKRNYDVILQLGYTSSSIWSFLFPRGSTILTNMDGLEWKRSKYSKPVRQFLKQAEKWAVKYSDFLIADSIGIQQYLFDKYGRESTFIAYGASLVTKPEEAILNEKGLEKYEYDLLIARMEPENNIETIIKGHMLAGASKPLIIIGNFKNRFGRYLKEQYGSERIQFRGPVYDLKLLNSLRYFSNLYFHGHSVGGTNPSLLEAMACYSLIVAHDNIFNRSVLDEDAFYFSSPEQLAGLLNEPLNRNDHMDKIQNNAGKILSQYSWDHIINQLENLLLNVKDQQRGRI
jgi:glycosyltransferase involved in cell wall biosynthesis